MDTRQNRHRQHKKNHSRSHSKIIAEKKRSEELKVIRPKFQKTKKTKVNYGLLIIIGLIILFFIWSINPITHRIEKNKEYEELQKQLSEIQKENKKLRQEVEYLKSPEYVEQKARSLGLSHPDEEVIVVIPENKKGKTKANKKNAENNNNVKKSHEKTKSIWDKALDAFSSIF